MNDQEFRALMNLVMASDPSPLSLREDDILNILLDKEAEERGYDSWYVAYHEFQKSEKGE